MFKCFGRGRAMNTHRCVWLEEGAFALRQLPKPKPDASKDALVRVLRAGVCSTDHQLQNGYYPFTGVPGHEFVGVVDQCPAAPQLVGKRVVADINLVCNACEFCEAAQRHHCAQRTVLGIIDCAGVWAEYVTLPSRNLIVVPDGVSDCEACFAEPLAAAIEIEEQVSFKLGQRVLVIGDGKLGLLAVHALALCRPDLQIFVAGHHEDKMALVGHYDNVSTAADRSLLTADTYHVVIECTGNGDAFADAVECARPMGTVVLKSTYADQLHAHVSQVVVKELTIVGSRCGPLQKAVDLLASKGDKLQLAKLVAAEYQLAEALDAIEHSRQSGVLKVQLLMS